MPANNGRYTMYGAEISLYSGKLRSYLRKKAIPFDERTPSIVAYKRFIVPRTGVRFIPVLHTPDDEVLQDTTEIIDALESRFPEPAVYPSTPRQRLAALLLELYGDEWLLIPAMHYRWNYPDVNTPWLYEEFGGVAFPWLPRLLRRPVGRRLARRFAGYVPGLGVTDTTIPAIEASYEALLGDLDAHLAKHRFLLGERPSIGDFGLIGPLYAHLFRDPYPGRIMRERAPNVVAWIRRMQADGPDEGAFVADDAIPDTLWPVLERMAREQVPVLVDTEWKLAEWHRQHPDRAQVPRTLGEHRFEIGGVIGTRKVLPHALWRWQRPRDHFQALPPGERAPALDLAGRLGLRIPLSARPKIRVVRRRNRFLIET